MYHKPSPSKCFRCFQPGHRSNECPNRKQIQLVSGETDSGYERAEPPLGLEVQDIQADEGEMISCITEKALLTPKQPSISQRHVIFRTSCTIEGKVCEVIIDSGCSENVISNSVVKSLQLKTSEHPKPYRISWIKKCVEVVVTDLCKVNFSIEKYFSCEVLCDFIEMDVCHLILGRL